MLEDLGLDTDAERVYRTMLALPLESTVADLAAHTSLTIQDTRVALERLSAMALVHSSQTEDTGFQVIGPEKAMEILLARQQAELAAHQMRVEASRAAAAQLIAECSVLRATPVNSHFEQLVGADAIRERLVRLADEVKREINTFAPGGAYTEDDLQASREPNTQLLQRGVRMRTIYLDSIRNHRPTLEHAARLGELGAQVRTVPTLPIRMIIADRAQVFLPLDTDNARAGAVVLVGTSTVTALSALFESVWAKATPLGAPPSTPPQHMPPQERAALELLTRGHTDKVIAKRLGVSPRTARRIAADLLDRLGARSRFQAGVHAVQDGWLPTNR
ncbi:LuxR C-terminal-related transcriptional regulator (plasmid) [Kitasatospora sp. NBC_00070]|uniref:helix-turn-helix transcriptional regulator n=1 Tax=Kitasatospora sp. NBC_00070 TaxID=2975962 RepID=UPI0032432315